MYQYLTNDLQNFTTILNSAYCYTQCRIKTTNLPHTSRTLPQPTITLYNIYLFEAALKVNFKLRNIYSPLATNIPTAVADPPTD